MPHAAVLRPAPRLRARVAPALALLLADAPALAQVPPRIGTLDTDNQALLRTREAAQADYDRMYDREMAPTLQKTQRAIDAVARRQQLAMVLDSRRLAGAEGTSGEPIWMDDRIDVTDAVAAGDAPLRR